MKKCFQKHEGGNRQINISIFSTYSYSNLCYFLSIDQIDRNLNLIDNLCLQKT